MLVVADSSALIALALCDALKLIDQLFKELKVPQTALIISTISSSSITFTSDKSHSCRI